MIRGERPPHTNACTSFWRPIPLQPWTNGKRRRVKAASVGGLFRRRSADPSPAPVDRRQRLSDSRREPDRRLVRLLQPGRNFLAFANQVTKQFVDRWPDGVGPPQLSE